MTDTMGDTIDAWIAAGSPMPDVVMLVTFPVLVLSIFGWIAFQLKKHLSV